MSIIEAFNFDLGMGRYLKAGQEYFFGELWDGTGDAEKLLDFQKVSVNSTDLKEKLELETIVSFTVVQKNDDNILYSIIKVEKFEPF